jgi:hypothetical protein
LFLGAASELGHPSQIMFDDISYVSSILLESEVTPSGF